MQQYYRGFSLLESLILLLVLSISMLGLGQLQVRLWVKAGSLHTLDEAYLLAVNLIEINEINSLFSLNSKIDPTSLQTGTSSIFRQELSVLSARNSTTNKAQVSWDSLTEAESVTLLTTRYAESHTEDARWLLPSN